MKRKICIIMVITLLLLIFAGCQKSDETIVDDGKIMRIEDWKDKHSVVYQSYLANSEMEALNKLTI